MGMILPKFSPRSFPMCPLCGYRSNGGKAGRSLYKATTTLTRVGNSS